MLPSITPRHPPRTGLQQPPTSIHHRTHPKPIISLDPRTRQPANMAVDMYTLPIALGHAVQLVVDAHVRPVPDVRVPPLPRHHVEVAVGEGVHALDGFEVGDDEGFVLRRARGRVEPVGGAQQAEFFVVRFEVDDHLLEVGADLLDSWGEDAEGVVVAEADVEDYQVGVGGFAAVGALGVGEGGGEFVHYHAVHEGVVFEACCCGGCAD